MTKITGKVLAQGVTLGPTSSILTTVGGLTINGGPGPAYMYATEYATYVTDNYTLTATAVAYPWQAWSGDRYGESNFAHTYSFSPSYAISAMTQLGIFETIGGFTEAVYAEYVVDALSTPLGTPVMQVGVESVIVPGTGYQPFYQAYYTNNGTIVQYLDGTDLGTFTVDTYAAGDVIGMIVYRTATTSTMTWFKNGIYVGTSATLDVNLTFARTRVNIGQNATGYPYGPIRHPVPVVTEYAKITLSSNVVGDYVYSSAYTDWASTNGYTYTLTSINFATGSGATYSDSNRSVTYPAAIAPWPHVTASSVETEGANHATIYELQNTVGDSTTTMLSRVGITATGVDDYLDADYGGGFGNYNAGDVIGVVVANYDGEGQSSVVYWFVNGSLHSSAVSHAPFADWQLYIDIGENIYRPNPS